MALEDLALRHNMRDRAHVSEEVDVTSGRLSYNTDTKLYNTERNSLVPRLKDYNFSSI